MSKEKKQQTVGQELSPAPRSPRLTADPWSGSTEPKILKSMGNALQDLGQINRSSKSALGPLKGRQGDGRETC